MKDIKISVIIPVYNTKPECLKRCIDSVINNSYKELEIICINDGSTNNSLEILNDYADSDSRFVVIDQKNAGVSAARNAGIGIAKGEFIAFVDSDDWVHYDYFKSLLDVQSSNNADLVICRYKEVSEFQNDNIIDSNIDFVSINSNEFFSVKTEAWIRGFIWGRIFRKSLISNHRFSTELAIMEDNMFNIEVIASTPDIKIASINEAMYYRYDNGPSLSKSLGSYEWAELSKRFISMLLDFSATINEKSRLFFLHEAFKKSLKLRYHIMYYPKNAIIKDEVNNLLREEYNMLSASKGIPFYKKVCYALLWKIPFVYRMYLILRYRTEIIEWDKRRKADAKNQSVNIPLK